MKAIDSESQISDDKNKKQLQMVSNDFGKPVNRPYNFLRKSNY